MSSFITKENGFIVIMDEEYPFLPKSCVSKYRKMRMSEKFIQERNDLRISKEEDRLKMEEVRLAVLEAERQEEERLAILFDEFKEEHPEEEFIEELFYLTHVKCYAKKTINAKMSKLRKELDEIDSLETGMSAWE